MTIPEKETNLDEVREGEFKQWMKDQKETPDTKTTARKLAELNTAYFDNTIKTMDEGDFTFTIKPYTLGNVYKILNMEDYCLIRDGFITIGGEASSGKTSFLTDLAIDLLSNDKDTAFLFYTLDDCIHISGMRIFSQLNNQNLFKGGYDARRHRDTHGKILKRIVLRDRINIDTLDREAVAVKKKTGCKKIIIGVDYLQAIPGDGNTDRRIQYNDNLKALKMKQVALNDAGGCILFCLSQLNRDSTSGAYRYRETSEIENQSDVCIDVELPNIITKEKKSIPDRETDSRFIRVTKNKMGRRGMVFKTTIERTFKFITLEDAGETAQDSVQRKDEITEGDLR